MTFRRGQKLLSHFGKAGIAVFAVEEVEYGGHDLASQFDLHRRQANIIGPPRLGHQDSPGTLSRRAEDEPD